jgi:hypothetical protein
LGQYLVRTDLDAWRNRLLDWVADESGETLQTPPHRIDKGDANRATWRLTTLSDRIELAPPELAEQVRRLTPPSADADHALLLRSSSRVGRGARPQRASDPGIRVHPDAGIADGANITVTTRHGSVSGTARHDDGLRPDVVDIPEGFSTNANRLLDATALDPVLATPTRDGLPCSVASAPA